MITLPLVYKPGDEVYDDLTRTKTKVVGVQVAVGYVAGTRYSGVAVGYWVDSPYLGGGRHPWEISEIKEG